MTAAAPSPAQLETILNLTAPGSDGVLERWPGGFWVPRGTAWEWRSERGEKYRSPVWSTTVQTVQAMERKGLLRRLHRYPEAWRDDRELTEAWLDLGLRLGAHTPNAAPARAVAENLLVDAPELSFDEIVAEVARSPVTLWDSVSRSFVEPRDVLRELEALRPGPLDDGDVVRVYHATDSATARELLSRGFIPETKPRPRGKWMEYAPGRGMDPGLYVGETPQAVEGYGSQILVVTVPLRLLSVPTELGARGVTDPMVALRSHDGAVIHERLPPEALQPLERSELAPNKKSARKLEAERMYASGVRWAAQEKLGRLRGQIATLETEKRAGLSRINTFARAARARTVIEPTTLVRGDRSQIVSEDRHQQLRAEVDAFYAAMRRQLSTPIDEREQYLRDDMERTRDITAMQTKSGRSAASALRSMKRSDAKAEADAEVERNIDAGLLLVWNAVKREIKGTAKMSRTEAFLHWVGENSEEVTAILAEKLEPTEEEFQREQEAYARAEQEAEADYGEAPF